MASDANMCRDQASKCARLAGDTTNHDLKRELLRMSESWLAMAVGLERAHGAASAHPTATPES